jgi:site-specific DNA recombinase
MSARAVIYARNSVDKKDSTTIEDQLRMCRDYAHACGFEIVQEFADPGISGTATANRPAFQKMMEAAKAREFRELLLMDMTRFSRNAGDCNKALDQLAYQKIRVHDVSKEIDSDLDTFRTLIDVDNLVSRLVVKAASKKSFYTLLGKAKRGEAAGGCPYGYRSIVRDDGKKWFEIVPNQAEIVRRIFLMRADGCSGRQIAHALNADGISSPAKDWKRKKRRPGSDTSRWHPAAIVGDAKKCNGILNNEIYKGTFVWNRSHWGRKNPETGNRERENKPHEERVRHDDPELRIVDDVLWQRVRARTEATQARTAQARKLAAAAAAKGLSPRRGGRPYRDLSQVRADGPVRYVLSGLLKCAVCGGNYSMCNGKLYACASFTNCGPTACANNQRFRRDNAQLWLLGSLAEELRNGEYLREWEAQVDRELRELRSRPSPLAALRQELAETEATIARLVEALASGELGSSPALAARLQAAETTKRNLTERLAEGDSYVSSSEALAPLRDASAAFADMLANLPDNLNDPEVVVEARAAIRDWIGEIVVEPTEKGPVARWRLSETGLLHVAGLASAPMVAGARFS